MKTSRTLTVLVHYRSLKVFSLGGWSPLLPTNSPGFVVLRMPALSAAPSCTGLSPALVVCSNTFQWNRSQFCWSYNPTLSCDRLVWALPASLATTTGISFDFSSSGY